MDSCVITPTNRLYIQTYNDTSMPSKWAHKYNQIQLMLTLRDHGNASKHSSCIKLLTSKLQKITKSQQPCKLYGNKVLWLKIRSSHSSEVTSKCGISDKCSKHELLSVWEECTAFITCDTQNTHTHTHTHRAWDTISYMNTHSGLNFPLSGQELRLSSELGW